MSDRAHVTDIEAIERYRSKLVVFLEKASQVLDEVSEEVKRTRIWLQTEQRLRLEHNYKRKQKDLELLEAELFTARLSNLQNAKTGAQMQVNQKRRELRELEDTMRAVSAWLRQFDSRVEPQARKVEKLRSLFDTEMVNALRYLAESAKLLRSYTGDGPPPSPG